MELISQIALSTGTIEVVGIPGGGGHDPVAVVLPAMGVPARYYSPFAESLAAHGITVVAADYPGHGSSTPPVSRRTDYGYAHLADEWLTAVVDAAVAEHPGRPVVLVTHSMGGHVALAHLARHRHPAVTGLVTLGSASPYWRGYDAGWRLLLKTQAVRVVSRVAGYWPGDRLGFGGRQPRRLMTEWSHFSRTGRLEPGGDPSYEEGMTSIDVPALVITLDNDALAPEGAVDELAAKLPSPHVERHFFTKGDDAPGRPVDHFSFARSPEVIDEVVSAWIREHAVRPAGSGPGVAGAQTS